MKLAIKLFILGTLFFQLMACSYKFNDFSFGDAQTFGMVPFTVDRGASLAPPDLGEQFSEALREKVRIETPLTNVDQDPNILFKGKIKRYNVLSVGPQGSSSRDQLDVGSDLSRLQIVVEVDYSDSADEKNNFKKDFTFHADFERDQNLGDIQDDLIQQIFDRILEDVFNQAFSNW